MRRKGFLTFFELILVIGVILFLCYIAFNAYFKKSPLNIDKETTKSLHEQNIDTSNYKAILDSSREKIKGVNKQLLNNQRQIETLGN